MNKKNILMGILLVLICLLGGIGIGYVLFDSVSNNDTNKNENSNNNTNQNNSFKVENMACENYETTFNGINIKVINNNEDEMMCNTDSILINGVELNKYNLNVDSYEIFDQIVIIQSSDTSGSLLTIYDSNSNKMVYSLSPDSLDNYWVDSYKIVNNKIVINARSCGEQCGVDAYYLSCDEIKENKSKIYPEVEYEISYNGNGKISGIKLVEKTSFENIDLYNKYYSHCK